MSSTMVPRPALHSVRFEFAEDFIDEMKPYDSPFMTFTLGMAMDYVSSPSSKSKDPNTTPKIPPENGTFHAIFDGDRLMCASLPFLSLLTLTLMHHHAD
ncbi:uncharacterized protein B0H18DRAFT_1001779 [Fomitopsis serialis]|uniref:uncharacterized protein n=1 Tax=Fomitopsis serialis TaxID=139415 RepID=UPI002008C33E|nr:uncharacterized protein B0H18DRAFT_1001779 [Neoantrodia serialis]KAH9928193.1 hypothetical protein B0H18DRAFT_1001779 [Neoantrodia serialis]